MNTKAPASLAFILLVLGGCSKSAVSIRLDAIDSLVVVEKYDSAYHEVLKMKPPFDKASDLAHYQLLLTQTSYLTNHRSMSVWRRNSRAFRLARLFTLY